MPAKSIRQFYDAREKYLFIGNGPNQLERRFSWDDLLKNLCREAGLTTERRQKSFPLFFEEISYTLDPAVAVEKNIQRLKGIIGKEALKLTPHALLTDIVQSHHYQHYLTTNYDYCVEWAIHPEYNPHRESHGRWPKYSLHRYNEVKGHRVWHIHGESVNGFKGEVRDYPESSIMIGFEHYSDYLEKIHHFIKSNTGKGLHDLIQKEQSARLSNWIHLFFTRDIDIIGFGMDYTEAHLWFILNFRARMQRSRVDIPNSIRWIIPRFSMEKQQDRIDLLRALNVEIIDIPGAQDDYNAFYRNFRAILS